MGINAKIPIRSPLLMLPAIVLFLTVPIASGQSTSRAPAQEQVATVVSSSASKTASNLPVFTDYRGVKIGMTADDVRAKLDDLEKGKDQDFLAFSDHESAQIYYDQAGKVMAISVDYFDNSNAPAPEVVLGETLQAKGDWSMYQMKRYPEAGYWVSYNRTAGDKPIVTITMQKM